MTLFTDVYDLFLISIRDFRLDSLYAATPTDFYNYLQGFLMRSIPNFDNCVQNLTNYDLTNAQFNLTLTLVEKNILADLMVLEWLKKDINDITQISNHLSDTDFKIHSEAQNLQQKSEYYNRIREIVNQKLVTYGLQNVNWTNWANGNFT